LREVVTIISSALNKRYTEIFFASEINMSEAEYSAIVNMIYKRYCGISLAKVINSKEFYGIEYVTNESTLDPRPETELIVDLFMKYFPDREMAYNILDLGCGTGCISISILKFYRNAIATLVDINADTIDIAKLNAVALAVDKRCNFIISDWFGNIPKYQKFTAIVCNPPYISIGWNLEKSVLSDPHAALFAGDDGLDAYRVIMPRASEFLEDGSLLLIEIGINQRDAVIKLSKDLKAIEIGKDIAMIERCIVFRRV
jgi:release factor glutamine methyltransferase